MDDEIRRMPFLSLNGDKCLTGNAVVTVSGDMPSRFCAHAVGPIYPGGRMARTFERDVARCDDQLRAAYKRTFVLLQQPQYDAQTVACSLLSAAIYRGCLPLDHVLRVGAEGILDGVRSGSGRIAEVYDVGYKASEAEALRRVWSALLPERGGYRPSAAISQEQSAGALPSYAVLQDNELEASAQALQRQYTGETEEEELGGAAALDPPTKLWRSFAEVQKRQADRLNTTSDAKGHQYAPGDIDAVVTVPSEVMRFVVGSKGDRWRQIEHDNNVKLQSPSKQHQTEDTFVYVVGKPEGGSRMGQTPQGVVTA